ncbi:LacI family DNA-binding transcriptional regulator [Pullulanibacillus sp. KACC 23026]|uniref:LacI family DNA-binding transcriptional regulator n=1 Tax=Pullulanibacillus sp. KACC 23026 TaxID=3028315 RepID=UPI0023B0BC05|nr:LacI family DNA-binding transcriptional regulator [Pullulanibacillus sp. KACC 23026]WEG13323.1 LacI family DNA-binding transcriptional regulator [Pullulanibacillus sp. KACC 23026]
MATIKDVARLSNVSVSTVSRVINSSGYVAKEVHERVVKSMKALNYQPNEVARGLVSKKTSIIGLIIPDVSNPFFSDIARGVEDKAIMNQYNVMLCNTDWQLERETNYIKLLQGKWVEGIVLAGTRSLEAELTSVLGNLPVVFVDRKPFNSASAIWSDNEQGGYMATNHLIENGCENIVHLSGPKDSPSAVARRTGFLKAIEEHPEVTGSVIQGDFRYNSGFSLASDLFSKKEFPDGIFAGNDLMAVGVTQAANRYKVNIPEDIKLIGYDNIAMSQYVYPSISTIAQSGYEMGGMALELLLESLERKEKRDVQQEFSPQLIIRKSTQK